MLRPLRTSSSYARPRSSKMRARIRKSPSAYPYDESLARTTSLVTGFRNLNDVDRDPPPAICAEVSIIVVSEDRLSGLVLRFENSLLALDASFGIQRAPAGLRFQCGLI